MGEIDDLEEINLNPERVSKKGNIDKRKKQARKMREDKPHWIHQLRQYRGTVVRRAKGWKR
jgi:hypothetical protein